MVLPLIMQVVSLNSFLVSYTGDMKRGRPSNKPRTEFGRRLYDARTAKGLSQAQVAEAMNVTQASYGAWERVPVALRPEQLEKLANLLDITVSYLFGEGQLKTNKGPRGKARQLFEQVSNLSRSQQKQVLDVVEAYVEQKTQRN
jgi:transcriptional regulator with XRE-family HTH domain